MFLYYTPKQDYYVVHGPDRFHDNSRRRRRRRRRRENRRAKVDLDSPLLSPPLHQPPSTKKKQRKKKRADNETRPMEKRTHLGDGLVLELTGSLGELRELGSL